MRVCIVSSARCGRSTLTRYFGRAEVQGVAAARKKIILAAQDLPAEKKRFVFIYKVTKLPPPKGRQLSHTKRPPSRLAVSRAKKIGVPLTNFIKRPLVRCLVYFLDVLRVTDIDVGHSRGVDAYGMIVLLNDIGIIIMAVLYKLL